MKMKRLQSDIKERVTKLYILFSSLKCISLHSGYFVNAQVAGKRKHIGGGGASLSRLDLQSTQNTKTLPSY